MWKNISRPNAAKKVDFDHCLNVCCIPQSTHVDLMQKQIMNFFKMRQWRRKYPRKLFSNVHSYELCSKYRLLTSTTACHLSSRNSLEWKLQCQLYCSYRQKVCRRQKFNWAHKLIQIVTSLLHLLLLGNGGYNKYFWYGFIVAKSSSLKSSIYLPNIM